MGTRDDEDSPEQRSDLPQAVPLSSSPKTARVRTWWTDRIAESAIDPLAASVAGLAAGSAFLATMEVDLRLTCRNLDDRILLGRPAVREASHAKTAGTIIHALNSLVFAFLYALVCDRIPGPPWWKGTLFFNIENIVLYPITALERHHPAIKSGQLAPYWNWPAFLQSIPRHIAFGAVLGIVYHRLRRR